jgi:uncharacterized protein (DUF983 family)
MTNADLTQRSVSQALKRGFAQKCPNCGEGKLFVKFLKVAPRCTACGQEFEGHRADDLPPYITITIVGHIIVALILIAERNSDWPIWLHMTLWPSLTIIFTLLLMQRIKGATIGYQWALRLHGFDPIGDVHEKLLPIKAKV